MSEQQPNFEEPEEELETHESFAFPLWLKIDTTVVSVLLLIFCLSIICMYIGDPKASASPKDLGVPSLTIFSLSALFLVWFPWEKLGLRITKIGGLEFEKIVKVQADERVEDVSYLEKRLDRVESKIYEVDEMANLRDDIATPQLKEILTEFLTKYRKYSFSPKRIYSWGSAQQGFSNLDNYDYKLIKRALQNLTAEGVLETRISKQGNTLYRISKP